MTDSAANFNYLVYWVVFTRAAATDVQLTVTARHPAAGTNDFPLPVLDVTTAAITYGFPAHKYTTSSSGNLLFVVPVPPGIDRVDAVISGTSGGASDFVDVYMSKVASE